MNEITKYVLVLNNGKFARLEYFGVRIFDVYEEEEFHNASLLTEEQADKALKQQYENDKTESAYDFGGADLNFEDKLPVRLSLITGGIGL